MGRLDRRPTNTLTGAANTHQVFNNILARVFIDPGKRYDPVVTNPDAQYSDNRKDRTDYASWSRIRYDANVSNELSDYNLFWRSPGMSVNGLMRMTADNSAVTEYNSIALWKASAGFTASKSSGSLRAAYAPGVEGNSTDADPQISAITNWPADRFNYRPPSISAITTAASGSLNGQNWWTTPPTWGVDYFPWNDGAFLLAPNNFKGPLDPSGATMPVGVQNP